MHAPVLRPVGVARSAALPGRVCCQFGQGPMTMNAQRLV